MTNEIKTSAIIAGILAVVAYAVYYYLKHRSTPISMEKILLKAMEEAKRINSTSQRVQDLDLIVMNPQKTKQFFAENKEALKDYGLSLSQVSKKLIVIWLLKNGDNVIYQEAIVSNALASDFTDVIPEDKIYRKKIHI